MSHLLSFEICIMWTLVYCALNKHGWWVLSDETFEYKIYQITIRYNVKRMECKKVDSCTHVCMRV